MTSSNNDTTVKKYKCVRIWSISFFRS